MIVSMVVNGQPVDRKVEPRTLLVHFLREELDLTGTNIGCETSLCGACTILVDGKAVRSCTQLAVQVEGCSITTIEGLAGDKGLHPLQQCFWDNHGLQCGYCTPGMILAAVDLLTVNPRPNEDEIRKGLKGNICRCTGYHNIVKAIQSASQVMAASQEGGS